MTRQLIESARDYVHAIRYDAGEPGAVRMWVSTVPNLGNMIEFSRGTIFSPGQWHGKYTKFLPDKSISGSYSDGKIVFSNIQLRNMGLSGSMLAQQMLSDILAAKEKMMTAPKVLHVRDREYWESPSDWRIVQVLR